MSNRGSVLVTGASSGIGQATAARLVREGFSVVAGVRKHEDGERLRSEVSDELMPVRLDVTDAESIETANHELERLCNDRLVGLVNNAGIGLFEPLEYLPLDDLRRIFDVNVLGQIALTQACLPLLRTGAGRVVNIASVGDRIGFPFGGALNASKSAFAAASEALRMELRPWGIHVVIIEPTSINTPVVDKALGDPDGLLRRMAPGAEHYYGRLFRTFVARLVASERDGSSPDVVAGAVVRALSDRRPRRRYPVGKDASLLINLPRVIPDWLLDPLRM
jgi:NAD(P)-dependent dehydrogenase (short-subunit alcohol dehydrogenase family)